jgi:hypothetical protein
MGYKNSAVDGSDGTLGHTTGRPIKSGRHFLGGSTISLGWIQGAFYDHFCEHCLEYSSVPLTLPYIMYIMYMVVYVQQ